MASTFGIMLRWLAGISLTASVGMVVVGESLLKSQLRAESFIYYWLICIVLTFLTLVMALADFWIVRRRSRREQKELVADALQAIVTAGGSTDELEEFDIRDF